MSLGKNCPRILRPIPVRFSGGGGNPTNLETASETAYSHDDEQVGCPTLTSETA